MSRLVVLTAVTLLAASACSGGSGGDKASNDAARRRAEQVRKAAQDAGLSDQVADLLGDAAGVVGARFRVTYDLGGDSGGTAVLTQDPPRRRVDVRSQVNGAEVARASITDRGTTTVCSRANGKWTCTASATSASTPGAFGTEQIDNVVGDLKTSRDAYDFRVGTRKVAGVDARCLVTELKPGHQPTKTLGTKGTLCISAQGVPLLVETPGASLRARAYTTSVPDNAFDPPAKVTS